MDGGVSSFVTRVTAAARGTEQDALEQSLWGAFIIRDQHALKIIVACLVVPAGGPS
jgi:hypothetical protein